MEHDPSELDREPVELIAEALAWSTREADEHVRQACVAALWRQGGATILMLAIAMTHAESPISRKLAVDLIGGLEGLDETLGAAANHRLAELLRSEPDPAVAGAVHLAMGRMLTRDLA